MKIDIREIAENDNWIGKTVWICDFRRPDLDKKAIRHVRPTKVIVRSNKELPPKTNIYYSNNHFCKLNTKGAISASGIIPVFDNTGYRSRTGTPVSVFDNEKECNEEYCKMSNSIIEAIDVRISRILINLNAEKDEIIVEKNKYI